MGFFSKVWSGVKKVARVAMIGGGTVLSLISPAAGGAVVTMGQAIGGAAIKLGGSSVDKVANAIDNTSKKLGLRDPVPIISGRIQAAPAINYRAMLVIAGVIVGLFLVFRKR